MPSDLYVNQDNYADGTAKPAGGFIGQQLLATNGNAWEWSGIAWVQIRIRGYTVNVDYFHAVAEGKIPGHSFVHKFGRNENLNTSTYEPVAVSGAYQTPKSTGAIALRVKAGGNVADAQNGVGAWELSLEGLDETGALVTDTIHTNATDGALVGADVSTPFMRLFRVVIEECGQYAGPGAPSHIGNIVIEDTSGNTWATIDATTIERGQSQIGAYSVPLNNTAYIYEYLLTTEANKPIDFIMFQRGGILDTSAPYQARRTVVEEVGIQGHLPGTFKGGQMFEALTDFGWLALGGTAGDIVTIDMEILLVAD